MNQSVVKLALLAIIGIVLTAYPSGAAHAQLDTASLRALLDAARRPGVVAEDAQRRHPLIAVIWADQAQRAAAMAREGASVRAFARSFGAVRLADAALANLNRPDALRPASSALRLNRRLSWLSAEARERVSAGERVRLAQRGLLDPWLDKVDGV